VVLALLAGSCAPDTSMQPTVEPVTLKVVVLPYLSYAPFFIAEDEGYLAEQGIKVEYVKLQTTPQAIPVLEQGQLDVMGASPTFGLLNAIARGANLRIVADKGYLAAEGCTYAAIVARRDLAEGGELEEAAQLRGRRIAFNPTSFGGYFLHKVLSPAGLTLDDIEPQDLNPAAQLEALTTGGIDLANLAEPWVSRAVKTGKVSVWQPIEQVAPAFQMSMIVFGPTLLDDNPDAGKRFMVAYLKGVRQYNEGKTERNLEIMAEHTGLETAVLEAACWPTLNGSGHIVPESLMDFQQWAVEEGYIDRMVTAEEFWDGSYIEYANEVLGSN
jgi:NitT/TauT family transport system substrate-binding protein